MSKLRLKILADAGRDAKHAKLVKVLCLCGTVKILREDNILHGTTKSCGCLLKEKEHGMVKTRLYRIWSTLNGRCKERNNSVYKHYGGRGIKVMWKSFKEFQKDMLDSYTQHVKDFGEMDTTIDRINNDSGYSKNNCRWATRKEQARNTRKNKILKFNGKELSIAEWAEIIGMPYSKLYGRFIRKWNIKKMLTTK